MTIRARTICPVSLRHPRSGLWTRARKGRQQQVLSPVLSRNLSLELGRMKSKIKKFKYLRVGMLVARSDYSKPLEKRVERKTFRHRLLTVMEHKDHWAWPAFTSGMVPRDRLHVHFEQEYATYVRDFPVMVGWAYVQCPIPEVRRSLAENLYEEETGGLVARRS